ncbi:5-methylcytosine restriction system specificity protein McrC [Leyella stercorea]|uniref:5-methylcytosine restriction system specificity protein McrC n=1 Tax=Leyella stercorea TaxID=363265 RepID=UPI00242F74C3|nr:hypothetical protein [Leyella stercorea]
MNPKEYTEHESFCLADNAELKRRFLRIIRECQNSKSLKDVKLMGMDYDFKKDEFFMSYYIGVDWIDAEKQQAMVVLPKIKSVDFQTMLMKCFTCDKASEDLDQVFFIRTEDKPIEIDSSSFQMEPLLIVYFINLINRIAKNGLKSGYTVREECLNSKIKGKVMMTRYIKHGIALDRREMVDCRYHEYNIDCVENRIIKNALLYCKQMIFRVQKSLGRHLEQLLNMYSSVISAFENVTAYVSPQELQHIHLNPVFKDYKEAISLARMIIKKRGYCVEYEKKGNKYKFPPFIIDMPVLFERYVYALLNEAYGKSVQYQKGTKADRPDFLKPDEQLIIDTKYITDWKCRINSDNVRQLSGYARSKGIRRRLQVSDDSTICPCMIVYPDSDGIATFCPVSAIDSKNDIQLIDGYIQFFKVGVSLPIVYSDFSKL